jgi:hypothetical protein
MARLAPASFSNGLAYFKNPFFFKKSSATPLTGSPPT